MAYVGHFDAGARMGALGDSIRQFGQDIQGIKDKALERERLLTDMDRIKAATEGHRKASEIAARQEERAAKEYEYTEGRRKVVDPISDEIHKTQLQQEKQKLALGEIKALGEYVTFQGRVFDDKRLSVEDAKGFVSHGRTALRKNFPDLMKEADKIGVELGDPAAFEEMLITNKKVTLLVDGIAIHNYLENFIIERLEKTPEGTDSYIKLQGALDNVRVKKAADYKELGEIYDVKMGRLEKRESLLGKAASSEALKEATVSKLRGYYGDDLVVNKAEILEGTKEPPPVKIHDDTMNMFRDVKSKAPPEETTAKQKILTEEKAFQMEAEEFSDKELRDLYRETVRSREGRKSDAPAFVLKELERRALAKEEHKAPSNGKTDFTLSRPSTKTSIDLTESSDAELKRMYLLVKGDEESEAYKAIKRELINRGLLGLRGEHVDIKRWGRKGLFND